MNQRKHPPRTRGFSLLELIGVLAIIAVLVVMFVPSVIKSVDQGTINAEISNLNTFSNALAVSIVQTKTVPAAGGIAGASQNQLPLSLNAITTNSRKFTRSFLVDPNLVIGSISATTLPYTQTNNLAIGPPSSARMLIVSTLSQGNPPVSTGVTNTTVFNDIWNAPANTLPTNPIWSPWAKYPNDVIIQRINLQPLFYNLILINHDMPAAATFSIDTTVTNGVPTNGHRLELLLPERECPRHVRLERRGRDPLCDEPQHQLRIPERRMERTNGVCADHHQLSGKRGGAFRYSSNQLFRLAL